MKEAEKYSDMKGDQIKIISLLQGRVEDANVKIHVTKYSTSPTKWIDCRIIWCLLSPFQCIKQIHPNCSWKQIFFTIRHLWPTWAICFLSHYLLYKIHKLCTSTCMAWKWIPCLCRQILSLFSRWYWSLSMCSVLFWWHTCTVEKMNILPKLLSLKTNHLMILTDLDFHQQFYFKKNLH